MRGEELYEYFSNVMRQVEKEQPELLQALNIFKDAEKRYNESVDAINSTKSYFVKQTTSRANKWAGDRCVSTFTK